jgi:ankyrin repeat protein
MSDSELISRCKEGNIGAVRELLAANANVNAFINGESPLLIAARHNNLGLLDIVLQAGADTTRVSDQGETAMMFAAQCGYIDVVKCLLQHQPASLLNARDWLGRTALFHALVNQKLDVASALLDAGADATIAANDGTTTLMVCSDVTIARRLLELGVDVNARYQSGKDALMLACRRNNLEIVSFLLDSGAERYIRLLGGTALHTACREGRTEVAALLLRPDRLPGDGDEYQRKRWLHAFDDRMQTALHMAVKGGHVGCVQALVDAGFDVNTWDNHCTPALIYTEDVEMARILLDAGTGEAPSTGNEGVITRACQVPTRIEVLRLLLQRFPDCDPTLRPYLHPAVRANNLEAVRLLVAARPLGYVNEPDTEGRTALFVCNNTEMMRLLLELGADPRVVDSDGQTSLMMTRNAACVRLLLEAAPDLVNKRDSRGWTAVMHMSSSYRRYEALEELFRYCEKHGLDAGVNNKDIDGDTALHMAMYMRDMYMTDACTGRSYLRVVKLLLKKGADALASGRNGMTVLMMAFLRLRPRSAKMDEMSEETSACLKAVLEAVLAHGAGGNAQLVDQPAAKRAG